MSGVSIGRQVSYLIPSIARNGVFGLLVLHS